MGSKTSGSAGLIATPRGGGALHGIGETFSPDLHTGTANFTIPLALPPGRYGFAPHLALVYSSGSGNGPFGVGWQLDVPGVARKTSTGVPRYDDTDDTFILSGAEDLVPVDPTPGAVRYRPRTEGLFARIVHHRHASPSGVEDYWEVKAKDGLVSLYGQPVVDGVDLPVIADPTNRTGRIFAWRLTQTTDPFGNRILYEYERDAGEIGPHRWDQLYLKRVRYIDFGDPAVGKFLASVTFVYDGADAPEASAERPDAFSEYRAGFEIRTRRRCRRIEVRTHPGEDLLVRTYELTYLDDQLPADQLPLNGLSLLSRIDVVGHDGETTQALPPLVFDYTRFQPSKRKFEVVKGDELPPVSLAHPDIELVDLFGSGLPDLLQMNDVVRYWRNLGDGHFGLPRMMDAAPAGVRLADPGVQLIDANGTGTLDLLVTSGPLAGYYPLTDGGLWDGRSFQRYRFAPSFDLKDPEVRLIDLDGDGVTDALRSGQRFECFFNDPKSGWSTTRRVERRALDAFPNVNFSDPRVKFADMSGDGLQDIVLIDNGRLDYWPNLGHGGSGRDWGGRVSMHHAPRFPYEHDPRRILVGDVDGDGAADLVYVEDRKITLWVNRAGNGWSDPIVITGTPPVTNVDAIRLVDLHGTGVAGVLWSRDRAFGGGQQMWFLDFTGGTKPYLLSSMDNSMGVTTQVAYASSTRFYLADQRRRETRWKTPLPFPVQVVARVEAIDTFSGGKLTSEFRYHHGLWDGAEREFRGFGRVDRLDSEAFDTYNAPGLHGVSTSFQQVAEPARFSPPTLLKTWFHQGPAGAAFGDWSVPDLSSEYWAGDPQQLKPATGDLVLLNALPRRTKRDAVRTLRGSVLRTELYALDGANRQDRPYTVTEAAYAVSEIVEANGQPFLVRSAADTPSTPPGDEEVWRVFLPRSVAQRTTQWERGDEPLHRFSFSDDHDDYGFPRTTTAIAVPRAHAAAAPVEPYLATLTRSDYAHKDDGTDYLVSRVTRSTSFEVLNDGSGTVFDLHRAIVDKAGSLRVIGQTVNYYDGPAFQGLAYGQLGKHGVLTRAETLVFTPEILQETYRSGPTVSDPPELPPYLKPGPVAWTDEYPQAFRDSIAPLAGYTFYQDEADAIHESGYFATAAQTHYDVQDSPIGTGRGLALATRDPLGRETSVKYDGYDLLPAEVRDPAGLITTAGYDYRTFQPLLVTDVNRNRAAFSYTPLGLPNATAVMGKEGQAVGDTVEVPSTRWTYDLLAYVERQQPVSVRTTRRVHHVNDTDVSLPERDDTIVSAEYSDGFGRLLQARAQAEDVVFGDDSLFGGAVLSVDQDAPVGPAVGRVLAPGAPPRVVVSGWQVYDNKGNVVERYEPFFGMGWNYATPGEAERGQKITSYYDPRGQMVRTVNPDGSEQRIVFGIPYDLADPEAFEPIPWEVYTYDANDNAGRTHGGDPVARSYDHHWDTPSSAVTDALGRTVAAVVRNRAARDASGVMPPIEAYRTRSIYDVSGNVLLVLDELGRDAFRHIYDLANRPLRTENIDAGVRRTLVDAAGVTMETRDSKGALLLNGNDDTGRPSMVWSRDGIGQSIAVRERLLYGDRPEPSLPPLDPVSGNLLGRVYRHYDGAGMLRAEAYDFKGNLLEKVRQVFSDNALLGGLPDSADSTASWLNRAFQSDWQPQPGATLADYALSVLDVQEFHSSFTYDGLSRIRRQLYPQDVEGNRRELRPSYNRAGALERVIFDGATYVDRIAYNAEGKQVLIVLGNGTMVRHTYDQRTFRIARMQCGHYVSPADITYAPTGEPLQDIAYSFDLVGNLLETTERTPGCGVLNNPDAAQASVALAQKLAGGDALLRRFAYDPLYRLLSATGRACKDFLFPPPWGDQACCGFDSGNHGTPNQDNAPSLTATFREEYTYDPAGNMLTRRLQRNGQATVRRFGLGGLAPDQWAAAFSAHVAVNQPWTDGPGNTLTHVSDDPAAASQTHFFDQSGNLIRETSSRLFEWDAGNRLRSFRNQAGAAEPSLYTVYVYDGSGNRVKKLTRKQGGAVASTIYIDELFEKNTDAAKQDNFFQIRAGGTSVAFRVGGIFGQEKALALTYRLGDHLGSISLVVSGDGSWINREEYTPHGETTFGSFAAKRYRFLGKERDEESDLYHLDSRLLSCWLGRWISPDPLGPVDGNNLYNYARANPLTFQDEAGTQSQGAGGGPQSQDVTGVEEVQQQQPAPWNDAPSHPAIAPPVSSGPTRQSGHLPDLPDSPDLPNFPSGPKQVGGALAAAGVGSMGAAALGASSGGSLVGVAGPAVVAGGAMTPWGWFVLGIGALGAALCGAGISMMVGGNPNSPKSSASSGNTGAETSQAAESGSPTARVSRVNPQLTSAAKQAGVLDEAGFQANDFQVWLHGAKDPARGRDLVELSGLPLSPKGGNNNGRFFATTIPRVAEHFAGNFGNVLGLALPNKYYGPLLARKLVIPSRDMHLLINGERVIARETVFEVGALKTLQDRAFFFHVELGHFL